MSDDLLGQLQTRIRHSKAEGERMATLALGAAIRMRLDPENTDGERLGEVIAEATDEVWRERGLLTPESGWDPS